MVSTLERRVTNTPLGQVLRLPCKFIQGKSSTEVMVINAIAAELAISGKNILPVMVKLLKEDKYTAVLNNQILIAAQQAKLDFVYCIVVDDEMAAQLKVEAGKTLKVNLNQASEVELIAAFENIKVNITAFNKIEPATIAQAIIKYRSVDLIKNLTFLTKLKCGIGKTKLSELVDRLVY
jgi:DNA uptake protein ComE-like DNA-binding protein